MASCFGRMAEGGNRTGLSTDHDDAMVVHSSSRPAAGASRKTKKHGAVFTLRIFDADDSTEEGAAPILDMADASTFAAFRARGERDVSVASWGGLPGRVLSMQVRASDTVEAVEARWKAVWRGAADDHSAGRRAAGRHCGRLAFLCRDSGRPLLLPMWRSLKSSRLGRVPNTLFDCKVRSGDVLVGVGRAQAATFRAAEQAVENPVERQVAMCATSSRGGGGGRGEGEGEGKGEGDGGEEKGSEETAGSTAAAAAAAGGGEERVREEDVAPELTTRYWNLFRVSLCSGGRGGRGGRGVGEWTGLVSCYLDYRRAHHIDLCLAETSAVTADMSPLFRHLKTLETRLHYGKLLERAVRDTLYIARQLELTLRAGRVHDRKAIRRRGKCFEELARSFASLDYITPREFQVELMASGAVNCSVKDIGARLLKLLRTTQAVVALEARGGVDAAEGVAGGAAGGTGGKGGGVGGLGGAGGASSLTEGNLLALEDSSVALEKACDQCQKELPELSYSNTQWRHHRFRRCRGCIEKDPSGEGDGPDQAGLVVSKLRPWDREAETDTPDNKAMAAARRLRREVHKDATFVAQRADATQAACVEERLRVRSEAGPLSAGELRKLFVKMLDRCFKRGCLTLHPDKIASSGEAVTEADNRRFRMFTDARMVLLDPTMLFSYAYYCNHAVFQDSLHTWQIQMVRVRWVR